MPLFKPGDPVEALELLAAMGVTVVLDRQTGKLRVRPRPVPALARELLQSNRALIHAVLLGKETGHAWAHCDECGEGRMVQTGHTPRCAMRPGCEGRHVAEEKESTKDEDRRPAISPPEPGEQFVFEKRSES